VLDDVAPLRQLDAAAEAAAAWLFAPSDAVRLHPASFQGTPDPKDEPMAENPPAGAIIDYSLASAPASPLTIEVLDPQGGLVRRFASDDSPGKPDLQKILVTPDWVPTRPVPGATPGAHRFVWNLRYPAPKDIPKSSWVIGPTGLLAPPGTYTVRLTAAGRVLTQPLVVKKDPRIPASDADLVSQFELARQIEAERVRISVGARQAASLRKQLSTMRTPTSSGTVPGALEALRTSLDRLAGPSVTEVPDELFDASSATPTSLRRLARSLRQLQAAVESADAAPTEDAMAGWRQASEEAREGLAAWQKFLGAELPSVNAVLEKAGLPPLAPD
jgi:hypothetical protein